METVLDLPVPGSTARTTTPSRGIHAARPPRPADTADFKIRTSLELVSELYNYNHWIFNKIRPFIRGCVCEVGCGIGTITQFLLNHERIVGIEPSGESLATSRARFAHHLNVDIAQHSIADCPCDSAPANTFDTVLCLNVLEHIEDDVDAVLRMRRLSNPTGRVIVLVPAHMSIYGRLDRSFGHYRRYDRRSLRRTYEEAGLRVVHSFYMNSLGYFGWLWHSRILKRTQIPVGAARLFNRLVPFLDALERLLPPPFGQSIVMVGTPLNHRG